MSLANQTFLSAWDAALAVSIYLLTSKIIIPSFELIVIKNQNLKKREGIGPWKLF